MRHRIGEEIHPDCIQETTKNPTSIMISACISKNSVGRLQVIDGTLKRIKYIDIILQQKPLPFISNLVLDNAPLFYQQNSSPWNTAWIWKQRFQDNNKHKCWDGQKTAQTYGTFMAPFKKKLVLKSSSNKRDLLEAIIVWWHHIIKKIDLQT